MTVTHKVLIVEDTPTLRSLIQVYLMSRELELHVAADGEEGYRLARELRPELIITDVEMPGMDGFELCAAIRSDEVLHSVPILMLTAHSDEATRRKGLLVGANAFLGKPVSVDGLKARVKELLPK